METSVLQAMGKVAGFGGLALGVFLLLFREVIRKNIFPTLSDDEAYRLIKQFMYLTFGIALVGIAAWTYITILSTGLQSDSKKHSSHFSGSASAIIGTWTADIKYNWGDTYHETFTFEIDGHELTGVATYVTGRNPISEGILEDNMLSFQTKSYTTIEDKQYVEKHHYKGKVMGDEIDFVLQTDSGYSSVLPIKFVAHRKA